MTATPSQQYHKIWFLIFDKAQSFMYLIVIGWVYVVLMMSIVEATSSTGTLLGALITFFLYGVGPVALVVYLMGAPARSKAIKKREAQARQTASSVPAASPAAPQAAESVEPDGGSHAACGTQAIAQDTGVAPVREET